MKLFYSPTSPFARKARIATALLGLDSQIELVAIDTGNPGDSLLEKNPLGKIPVLELDDGTCIYDSPVILAFLDDKAGGGRLIPREASARFAALTLEALADGMADASVLLIYEVRLRAENERSPSWVARQNGKVSRALARLEAAPPAPAQAGSAHVGQIALACALSYLDLRFEGAWRADHPKLVAWLDAFAAVVPAFAATKAP